MRHLRLTLDHAITHLRTSRDKPHSSNRCHFCWNGNLKAGARGQCHLPLSNSQSYKWRSLWLNEATFQQVFLQSAFLVFLFVFFVVKMRLVTNLWQLVWPHRFKFSVFSMPLVVILQKSKSHRGIPGDCSVNDCFPRRLKNHLVQTAPLQSTGQVQQTKASPFFIPFPEHSFPERVNQWHSPI